MTVLSGGTTVTGRSPTVEILDNNLGWHFDFAVRAFNAAPATTGLALASAIDGLYREDWDVSGLFVTNTFLTFEYHDATALALDDVAFVRPPITTGDINISVGGGFTEQITLKGNISDDEKRKLFKQLDTIENDIEFFRQTAIGALKQLIDRRVIKLEDIQFLTKIKERDLKMFEELLKLLELQSNATEKELFSKLTQIIERKNEKKQKFIEALQDILIKLREEEKLEKSIPEEDEDDE